MRNDRDYQNRNYGERNRDRDEGIRNYRTFEPGNETGSYERERNRDFGGGMSGNYGGGMNRGTDSDRNYGNSSYGPRNYGGSSYGAGNRGGGSYGDRNRGFGGGPDMSGGRFDNDRTYGGGSDYRGDRNYGGRGENRNRRIGGGYQESQDFGDRNFSGSYRDRSYGGYTSSRESNEQGRNQNYGGSPNMSGGRFDSDRNYGGGFDRGRDYEQGYSRQEGSTYGGEGTPNYGDFNRGNEYRTRNTVRSESGSNTNSWGGRYGSERDWERNRGSHYGSSGYDRDWNRNSSNYAGGSQESMGRGNYRSQDTNTGIEDYDRGSFGGRSYVYNHDRGHDEDRGLLEKASDRVRSWFGNDRDRY